MDEYGEIDSDVSWELVDDTTLGTSYGILWPSVEKSKGHPFGMLRCESQDVPQLAYQLMTPVEQLEKIPHKKSNSQFRMAFPSPIG